MRDKKVKALIYGNGNLGDALARTCQTLAISYHLTSKSQCRYSDDFSDENQATVIFNTIGGKPGDTFNDLYRKNIEFNNYLSKQHPNIPIFAFSASEALESWRSPFGTIKSALEKLAEASTNIFLFRVANLYGSHKPANQFPQKIKAKYPKPSILVFPGNPIQPTPVLWLALKILSGDMHEGDEHIKDIAPSGLTTYAEWASEILGAEYNIKSGAMDTERNVFRTLNGKTNPHWRELWIRFKV